MKKLLKIILSYSLFIFTFISCSGDSSDDGQEPDRVIVENLENLKDDSTFLATVQESFNLLIQVKDVANSIILLEKEELTDQENTELALALGFDSEIQMEDHYKVRFENWNQLYTRFDLTNQNEDEVVDIINNAHFKLLSDAFGAKSNILNYVKNLKDDCLFCLEHYQRRTDQRVRRRWIGQKICWDIYQETGGDDAHNKCFRDVLRLHDSQLFKDWTEYICCIHHCSGVDFSEGNISDYCEIIVG